MRVQRRVANLTPSVLLVSGLVVVFALGCVEVEEKDGGAAHVSGPSSESGEEEGEKSKAAEDECCAVEGVLEEFEDEPGSFGGESLRVRVSATPGFLASFDWVLEKAADVSVLELGPGESGTVLFQVSAIAMGVDYSDYYVEGEVLIMNPTDFDAQITEVLNLVEGQTGSVDCGVTFPYVLEARRQISCTYRNEDVPRGADESLAVVEVADTSDVLGASATEMVVFFDHSEDLYGEVTLTAGRDKEILYEGCHWENGCWFEYEETFSCPEDAGTVARSVRIDENDMRASAVVEIECRSEGGTPAL